MKTRTLLLPLLVTAFAVAPAFAETLWLEPSPNVVQAHAPVTVRLMLGDRFAGEERAMDGDKVVSFQRLRKNGRRNLPREDGQLPVAAYESGDPGVEILSLTWEGKSGGYYCKAVQVVGEARAGHPLRFSELGQRLEIVPQTDPVLLARDGGTLEVQVLYEKEPLAGIRLLAMPQSDAVEQTVSRVTDEIGIARFDLDREGLWLIEVAFKTGDSRSRASLVLAAGAP